MFLLRYNRGVKGKGKKQISEVKEDASAEERSKVMKLTNIKDVDGFFKVIDQCKGKVYLVTGEGDRLNLKSKLTQYVSLAQIFSGGEIPEMDLMVSEPEDLAKLMDFTIKG